MVPEGAECSEAVAADLPTLVWNCDDLVLRVVRDDFPTPTSPHIKHCHSSKVAAESLPTKDNDFVGV